MVSMRLRGENAGTGSGSQPPPTTMILDAMASLSNRSIRKEGGDAGLQCEMESLAKRVRKIIRSGSVRYKREMRVVLTPVAEPR